MDLNIDGKVALVTASSRGIGYATAMSLSEEGARVYICSRTTEDINAAARSISEKTDGVVIPITADVTVLEDIDLIYEKISENGDTVDILVCNAGGPKAGNFLDFDDNEWEEAVDLSFMSAVRLSRKFAPSMIENQWGRIIYITSMSARQPIEGLVLSNATRTGVTGIAKTQALEWAESGVLVNSVCPGTILTDRIKNLYGSQAKKEGKSLEQKISEKEEEIPVGKLGKPEDVANMIIFLCSEKASYITGHSFPVDGGLIKGLF